MIKVITSIILVGFCFAIINAYPVLAGDNSNSSVVDLRGKKGIIDPSDLKKHTPPKKSLKTKEPPSPTPPPDVPPFETVCGNWLMNHRVLRLHYLYPADENIPGEGTYTRQNPTSRQQPEA